MDRDTAIRKAAELIKSDNDHGEMKTRDGDELVIVEDEVLQYEIAWLVPCNTRAYLENGDFVKCIFPGTVVVPSDGGKVHHAPSMPPADEYIAGVKRHGR